MATASTLITQARNLANVDGTDIPQPGLQDTAMLSVLNDAYLDYLESFKEGGGEPPSKVGKEFGCDLIASTALAANTTTSSTSITVDDSSDAEASGAFVIYDDGPDIGEFTGNAANTLSGVTGLGYAHEDGDEVSFLYELPSDYESPRSTAKAQDGMLVDDLPYYFTTGEPTGRHFAIYDNGTDKFLWFPKGLTGSVNFAYNSTQSTIDETTDTLNVPASHNYYFIWRLVEHIHAVNDENGGLIQYARANWQDRLAAIHRRKNVGKKVRTRPFRRSRMIYGEDASFYPII